MPQSDHGGGVGEGTVVGGDDGSAALEAHGPALDGGVGAERDDVGAVGESDGCDDGEMGVNSPLSKNLPRRTSGWRGSRSASLVVVCFAVVCLEVAVMSGAPEDEGDIVAAESE